MYNWRVCTIVYSHGDATSVAIRSKCVLSWKRSWAGSYNLKEGRWLAEKEEINFVDG